MQWKQWNSHSLSLGDSPQTNMWSECLFWLLWRCIDYIAIVSEDSDWEFVPESWWQMWFSLLGIVSDSAFPASLQNLNSTVYVFCSYVQNVQCWWYWERASWQKVFSIGQKYWKYFKLPQHHSYFPFLSPNFLSENMHTNKRLHSFSLCFWQLKIFAHLDRINKCYWNTSGSRCPAYSTRKG